VGQGRAEADYQPSAGCCFCLQIPPIYDLRDISAGGGDAKEFRASALPNRTSTSASIPLEDQAKEQPVALAPYVTQVGDLFNQLVTESRVGSRCDNNRESVSLDTALKAGKGAISSRTEAGEDLSLCLFTSSMEFHVEGVNRGYENPSLSLQVGRNDKATLVLR
jgi:hypothetical protein